MSKTAFVIIKKIIGYFLLISPIFIAYKRGKKEGELICIDFNVLPFVPNFFTFVFCVILLIIGVKLISKN